MRVGIDRTGQWYQITGGLRDQSRLAGIPGLRKVRDKRDDPSVCRWKLPATLAASVQLRNDVDDAAFTAEAKLHRSSLLAARRRRLRAKRGEHERTDLDPRLSPAQQNLQALLLEGSALVGWDMGTGKTPITCSTIALAGFDTALVIGTKTNIYWWVVQLREWTDLEPFIFHGPHAKKSRAAYEAHEGPKAIVSTHGMLNRHGSLEYWRGATVEDTDEKDDALFDQWYDVCVIDESHKVGFDPAKPRVRAMHHLYRNTGVRWALSGTPIERNIEDAWTQLKFVDPTLFPERGPFRNRYCITLPGRWGGIDNLGLHPDMEEEFFWLVDAYFDRKLKREALADLPAPLEPQYLVLPMAGAQAKAYRDITTSRLALVEGGLISATTALDEARFCGYFANGIPEIDPDTGSVIGMSAPSNKLDYILEQLEDRNGDPFVVYAHSPLVVYMMLSAVRAKGYTAQAIIGDTPAEERRNHEVNFQAGNINVLFINEAGAESLTLTTADTIVFVQPSWRAITNQQARDRIDRWGQERQCHFIYLLSAGTVDESQRRALGEKVEAQEQLLRDKAKLKAFLEGTWTYDDQEF